MKFSAEMVVVFVLAWALLIVIALMLVMVWFNRKSKRAYIVRQDESGQLYINESKVNELDVVRLIKKNKICIYRGNELKIKTGADGTELLNNHEIDKVVDAVIKSGVNVASQRLSQKEDKAFGDNIVPKADVEIGDGNYYKKVKFA
ncbi:MAG: hypothetical protein LBT17_01075 [Mycoplasmataceae bacterium]|jgi:hypothetical protein|nr:hypothetical protein [Mycoplasmataceae bacterium]